MMEKTLWGRIPPPSLGLDRAKETSHKPQVKNNDDDAHVKVLDKNTAVLRIPKPILPLLFHRAVVVFMWTRLFVLEAPGQVAWNGPKGQSRINSRLDCISECDAARYIVLSSQILASSTKQVDDLNILFYFYLQHLLSIVLSGSTGNRTRAPL